MIDQNPGGLDLDLELIRPIIQGSSAIDTPRLFVRCEAEAEEFLESYGYRWSDLGHRVHLEELRQEAWAFIEQELLNDEPDVVINKGVRAETDLRKVLLDAAVEPNGDPQGAQIWACTLLRMMHTLAHCGSTFRSWFGQQIEEQVVARFEPHIIGSAGSLQLGRGDSAIPLASFRIKGSKTRKSLAMKLLHKVDHVAADVFDHMGVRFVTKERYDALLVAQYLRQQSIIMFAHIKPGRSRNTLIDMELLDSDIRRLAAGETVNGVKDLCRDSLRELTRSHPYPRPPGVGHNVFTSIAYHSIQFTCAQQIVIEEPDAVALREHLVAVRNGLSEDPSMVALLERLSILEEIRFLFPYEIQIIDEKSYEEASSGLAAHDVYKARQRHAVKKRLWGSIIKSEAP